MDNDLTLQISRDYGNAPYTIRDRDTLTRTLYYLVANRNYVDGAISCVN